MMLSAFLVGLGGAFLLAGLLLALSANRETAKAIRAVEIREDIVGTVRDHAWWQRGTALSRADRRFQVGVGLTVVGVVLQTIGSAWPR